MDVTKFPVKMEDHVTNKMVLDFSASVPAGIMAGVLLNNNVYDFFYFIIKLIKEMEKCSSHNLWICE